MHPTRGIKNRCLIAITAIETKFSVSKGGEQVGGCGSLRGAQPSVGLLSFGLWGPGHPLGPAARPDTAAPSRGGGGGTPLGPAPSPRRHRRGAAAAPALAQARGGHVGRRGAAFGPLPRCPPKPRCCRLRCCCCCRCRRRGFAAPRRAAGRGRGSGGRRGTAGRRGGPGQRRSGPSRRGCGGSGVGSPAAAEGAAVGGAVGAVRGAGVGAAVLRSLPALLDVRGHPRPRRAAAGRAERLLRLQPRLRRHRRDADGRAAGAGAALPARRRQLAAGPAAGAAPATPAPRTTDPRRGWKGVISMQNATGALLLLRFPQARSGRQ